MDSIANKSEQVSQSTSTVFVGRQPIYTRDAKTFAYELLFRSDKNNRAAFIDGEKATANLILNTFAEIGLERIVGNLPAFINIPEEFLLNGHCLALPQERVVLEILEDVRPTQEVLEALTALRREGYTIALDDFVYSPELVPLVAMADIVKVDLPLVPKDELAAHVDFLRQYDLRILAEKVETEEEFEICKALKFDYYQGYFFCRPTIVEGKQLPTNRASMVRLISKLQSPMVDLDEITDVIQTEPALAYKLLRYVNSACCALTHKVESIRHAVTITGVRQIKTISCLSLLAQAADEKPMGFIQTLLVRARMAELLGEALHVSKTDSYFLAGLFSGIDALLDLPIEEALGMVQISKEVEDAITQGTGTLGAVLNCVLEYERGNWEQVSCLTIDDKKIRNAYLNAIEWANDSMNVVET